MSVHQSVENYNCPNCNVFYFPYKEDLPCPSCKIIPTGVPEENFGAINNIITNMRINLSRYGTYTPAGFYVGSILDQINLLVSVVFEKLDEAKREDGEVFINEHFDSLDFGDEKRYLKDSIKSMTLEIYVRRDEFPKEIEEEKEITEETKAPSLWARLISKLKR